jgi:choline-sulfatase
MSSTLVAFTSDHGDYAGHRGILLKTPWLPFEDLVRVPLLYAGAGVAGGRVVSDLVQSYDFVPTALDCAGVDPADLDLDSRSLWPFLGDRAQPADRDHAVFSCIGTPVPMVRHGRYKYYTNSKQPEVLLFDLVDDPAERVNLADDPDYAGIRRDLSERLAQRMAKRSLVGGPDFLRLA